ncbi:MAG: leucine-rich repeat protein [Ruminococcus sp.]|jgi:hypothetical protein|nr:leucine-rich repeat protein [Ruminococcus sp.]
MKIRKLLAAVLSAVMLCLTLPFTALPVSAAAQQIGTSSTYWEIIDDTLYITGTGAMPDFYSLEYPWKNLNFTSASIEDGVTSIGVNSFYNCSSLSAVTISEGVESIGSMSFMRTSLESVTIPSSVTSIGAGAFNTCSSLSEVTISEGVESIGETAFMATALTSISIPSSVVSISGQAFQYCTSLSEVTISEGVESIGMTAFANTALTSITIPSSVKTIGSNAFRSCSSLSEVIISEGVEWIGDLAFADCSLSEITIPASVDTIGDYVFYGCDDLTTINVIPGSTAASFNFGVSAVVASSGTITYAETYNRPNSNPDSYNYGTGIPSFAALSDRDGYKFNGWSPSSIGQSEVGAKTITAQWLPRNSTPTAVIDFTNETLTGLENGGTYQIGVSTYTATGGVISITSLIGSEDIQFVHKGNGTTTADSIPTTINIPYRPAAPSLTAVNESSYGGNNGKIIGLNTSKGYNYKKTSDQYWTEISNKTEITGLAPGTYYVRLAANTSPGQEAFASPATELTISAYVRNTNAELSALTVDGATPPGFPSESTFDLNVLYDKESVVIIAAKAEATALMTGDTGTQTLAYGDNAFTITVTAESGTSKTYTININRAKRILSTPTVTISYAEEKIFMGETAEYINADYTIDGDPYTTDDNGKIDIDTDWFGDDIAIIKKGDGVATADSSTKMLSIPNRPAAPSSFLTENESVYQGNDGKITGLTAATAYEYKLAGGNYAPVSGVTEITGLSPGTYSVRLAANTSPGQEAFASPATELTINAYIQNTEATLSDLTINGNTIDGFLSNKTAYTLTVLYDTASVTIGGTLTDTEKAQISGDLGLKTLKVGSNSFTVTATAEDGTQTPYRITITRQPKPEEPKQEEPEPEPKPEPQPSYPSYTPSYTPPPPIFTPAPVYEVGYTKSFTAKSGITATVTVTETGIIVTAGLNRTGSVNSESTTAAVIEAAKIARVNNETSFTVALPNGATGLSKSTVQKLVSAADGLEIVLALTSNIDGEEVGSISLPINAQTGQILTGLHFETNRIYSVQNYIAERWETDILSAFETAQKGGWGGTATLSVSMDKLGFSADDGTKLYAIIYDTKAKKWYQVSATIEAGNVVIKTKRTGIITIVTKSVK